MDKERIFTGVSDRNGNKIYSDDKVKYFYYRCGRLSYRETFTVEWGYDEEENEEGWLLGGYLLRTVGKLDNEKIKEEVEIVSS